MSLGITSIGKPVSSSDSDSLLLRQLFLSRFYATELSVWWSRALHSSQLDGNAEDKTVQFEERFCSRHKREIGKLDLFSRSTRNWREIKR